MKMVVYSCDEIEASIFRGKAKEYGVDAVLYAHKPLLENADLTLGADVVNILSASCITAELLDRYRANGVKLLVSRTIGVEHIDTAYAASVGIQVENVTYSPASVADYAIMMMLMVLRHIKPMMQRYVGQDYTPRGYLGRELPDLTVGIVGMGRIGETTARHLTGFGCRILAYNRTPRKIPDGVQSVDLDTLYRESDIVSLHIAATEQTHHWIDAAAIGKMKQGAVLINTARGTLVDSAALIDALESGKLSGAGLDVFDGDRTIYYRDFKNEVLPTRERAILDAMPNVLMLPHMAYYTDRAVQDMVLHSLDAARRFFASNT